VNAASAYATTQRLLSLLLCAVGVVMVVSTLARGGGPLAIGVIVGVMFALLGAARLWLARASEAEPQR
jgi:hypothetical protein